MWTQVEWWLEHRHGWLVKHRYLESFLAMNTKCLVPLQFLLDLILWSTENHSHGSTVLFPPKHSNRARWSRIGLAVLILHAAGVGLTGRPAVIRGRYNKCRLLQLQNHYTHFPPLQHTHTFMQTQLCGTGHGKRSWVSRHCMLAVAGGIICVRVKTPIDQ